MIKTVYTKNVALGDSITQGYPFGSKASWVNILKNEHGLNIENKGINGDTLEGMLERFDNDVKFLSPKLVIVMGGTNDVFDGYSLSAMEYNLKQIVKRAEALSIKPIIGIPIPVDDPAVEAKLKRFRFFLKEFTIQNKIPVINFYNEMVDSSGKIKAEYDFDGVHPSREGYKIMSKVAHYGLKEILNRSE
jgi:acyl-CoA thioesterase-1